MVDVYGEWDCPRCGENAVLPKEAFLSTFGNPKEGNPLGIETLGAVTTNDGLLFPVKSDGEMFVPEMGGYVDMWDDPEIVDARIVIAESTDRAVCSWCYETFDLKKVSQ